MEKCTQHLLLFFTHKQTFFFSFLNNFFSPIQYLHDNVE